MSEKELVEQLKQIVLHAEQEAMKQSLNAKAEHKLEIEAKADGVMELCKAMRKVIADYDVCWYSGFSYCLCRKFK